MSVELAGNYNYRLFNLGVIFGLIIETIGRGRKRDTTVFPFEVSLYLS